MQELKKTLCSDSFWLRTVFMLVFFLVYRLLDVVLLLTTIGQWLYTLFAGEPQPNLRRFGASLGLYLQQITYFLTAASEQKPFPFSDWPTDSSIEVESNDAE